MCLLILMSVSGPFSLASGGFLAAPALISSFKSSLWNSGKAWSLANVKRGTKGPPCLGAPQAPLGFTNAEQSSMRIWFVYRFKKYLSDQRGFRCREWNVRPPDIGNSNKHVIIFLSHEGKLKMQVRITVYHSLLLLSYCIVTHPTGEGNFQSCSKPTGVEYISTQIPK